LIAVRVLILLGIAGKGVVREKGVVLVVKFRRRDKAQERFLGVEKLG